jgi:hypothetical protein
MGLRTSIINIGYNQSFKKNRVLPLHSFNSAQGSFPRMMVRTMPRWQLGLREIKQGEYVSAVL